MSVVGRAVPWCCRVPWRTGNPSPGEGRWHASEARPANANRDFRSPVLAGQPGQYETRCIAACRPPRVRGPRRPGQTGPGPGRVRAGPASGLRGHGHDRRFPAVATGRWAGRPGRRPTWWSAPGCHPRPGSPPAGCSRPGSDPLPMLVPSATTTSTTMSTAGGSGGRRPGRTTGRPAATGRRSAGDPCRLGDPCWLGDPCRLDRFGRSAIRAGRRPPTRPRSARTGPRARPSQRSRQPPHRRVRRRSGRPARRPRRRSRPPTTPRPRRP